MNDQRWLKLAIDEVVRCVVTVREISESTPYTWFEAWHIDVHAHCRQWAPLPCGWRRPALAAPSPPSGAMLLRQPVNLVSVFAQLLLNGLHQLRPPLSVLHPLGPHRPTGFPSAMPRVRAIPDAPSVAVPTVLPLAPQRRARPQTRGSCRCFRHRARLVSARLWQWSCR